MRNILLIILFLVSPVVLGQAPQRSITIVAEGYVEAVPDTLSFPITIKHTKPSLSQARAATDLVVKDAIEQARSLGIAEDDIDSSSMQAFPEYEWRQQQRHYLGESVVRTVVFTLRDLEQYPALAQRLSKLPLQQIGSPQLSHSNISELRLDALRAALGQGKVKAAAIAAEIDAELGKVISVSEISRNRPQPRLLMAEAADADTAGYNYGKRRISASVEMRFGLQ
ncbi:MAG: SIMPL domain-containing protein, partial [Gammaproteobacteria bacterium]|nr:SIMPL domain-containing protein [Gammaproteobacteria bacterium]